MNIGKIMNIFKAIGKGVAYPFRKTGQAIEKGTQVMVKEAIFGIIRHVLTTVGGAVVGSGYINSDEYSQGVGAVLTLVGIVWSVVNKKKAVAKP